MKIGTAAYESAVSAKRIRYYERIGRLPAAARQHEGHREYSEDDVHVLRFISRARSVGFSVEEVRSLVDIWRDKSRSCTAVEARARRQLAALNRKMEEAEAMQRTLQGLIESCED